MDLFNINKSLKQKSKLTLPFSFDIFAKWMGESL